MKFLPWYMRCLNGPEKNFNFTITIHSLRIGVLLLQEVKMSSLYFSKVIENLCPEVVSSYIVKLMGPLEA